MSGRSRTHIHRRSNPYRPDRTRQVVVSGRGRDTHSQAVKSLPARPHSAGSHVREEPRHTYTGGLPCRPDRTRQAAVSGRSRDTRSQAVKSLPARPHSAGRRVREEPRHTFTGGYQIPAGQTAFGRSLCQGGAATHIHRRSSLPARPHSAGHRAREEPRHTFTCGQIPGDQTALSWSPCHGGAATQIHMWPTLLARSHSLKYCKLTSLDAFSSKELHPRNCKAQETQEKQSEPYSSSVEKKASVAKKSP